MFVYLNSIRTNVTSRAWTPSGSPDCSVLFVLVKSLVCCVVHSSWYCLSTRTLCDTSMRSNFFLIRIKVGNGTCVHCMWDKRYMLVLHVFFVRVHIDLFLALSYFNTVLSTEYCITNSFTMVTVITDVVTVNVFLPWIRYQWTVVNPILKTWGINQNLEFVCVVFMQSFRNIPHSKISYEQAV
jgi:hypothetical protein